MPIFVSPAICGGVLAFVRSGFVNLSGGNIDNVGYGYGWSRTAVSTTNARYLAINPTAVYPSYSASCWIGLPLRCLYPGSAYSQWNRHPHGWVLPEYAIIRAWILHPWELQVAYEVVLQLLDVLAEKDREVALPKLPRRAREA